MNAKAISVSDSDGTLHFKDGITEEQLEKVKELKLEKRGRLRDWSEAGGEYLEGEKPWNLKVDIAIPCATQNEISEDDAKILCENGVIAICEGANNPLDTNAVDVVLSKNILFLPAKAANAGGVAISGIERSQNSTHRRLSKSKVDEILQEIMHDIHDNCCKFVEKESGVLPYKVGANRYAFEKVTQATNKLRGHSKFFVGENNENI